VLSFKQTVKNEQTLHPMSGSFRRQKNALARTNANDRRFYIFLTLRPTIWWGRLGRLADGLADVQNSKAVDRLPFMPVQLARADRAAFVNSTIPPVRDLV